MLNVERNVRQSIWSPSLWICLFQCSWQLTEAQSGMISLLSYPTPSPLRTLAECPSSKQNFSTLKELQNPGKLKKQILNHRLPGSERFCFRRSGKLRFTSSQVALLWVAQEPHFRESASPQENNPTFLIWWTILNYHHTKITSSTEPLLFSPFLTHRLEHFPSLALTYTLHGVLAILL